MSVSEIAQPFMPSDFKNSIFDSNVVNMNYTANDMLQ